MMPKIAIAVAGFAIVSLLSSCAARPAYYYSPRYYGYYYPAYPQYSYPPTPEYSQEGAPEYSPAPDGDARDPSGEDYDDNGGPYER
jgi:hypothetical protein